MLSRAVLAVGVEEHATYRDDPDTRHYNSSVKCVAVNRVLPEGLTDHIAREADVEAAYYDDSTEFIFGELASKRPSKNLANDIAHVLRNSGFVIYVISGEVKLYDSRSVFEQMGYYRLQSDLLQAA